jgi:predicted Zn-dependent protease
MQTYFYELADYIGTQTLSGETYLAYLSAEESNFVRFNQCLVRQAGSVKQSGLTLSLISKQRRAESHLTLSGLQASDRALIVAALDALRRDLIDLPEDPYLLFNQNPQSTERISESKLASDADILDQVVTLGKGKDLVGIYAAGAIYKGFANSLGQRNWHRVDNFNFEWCLYHTADKAVKNSYAGTHWDGGEFARKMSASSEQLAVLKRAPKQLDPGQYRAYLAPSAMNEILGLLSWESFGEKAQRTKQSPLLKLEDGTAALNPAVHLQENSADGIAPGFQADGFIKTSAVKLVESGKHAGALVSPRSAREFAIDTNGANGAEAPEALDMAAGRMHRDDVLTTLGTGIFIGNLHYLNFSDRRTCRMTGMTRFATFWVEKGVIKAPLNVMRFDDSAYRVLGENLLALTAERELILDSGSYGERSTGSARLPGGLVKDFALTL